MVAITFLNLPKAILNLLPMWQYDCPICFTTLGFTPVTVCYRCGSRFTAKNARRPPQIYKDKKALSNFVHTQLIPTLSYEQQLLVREWFTIHWSDGFESGISPPWDGTQVDAGCSITQSAAEAREGSNSALSVTDNDDEYASCYEDIATSMPRYARIYVKFTALPSSNTAFNLMNFQDTAWGRFLSLILWNNGGTYTWKVFAYHGSEVD
jgi:hypothetical protein